MEDTPVHHRSHPQPPPHPPSGPEGSQAQGASQALELLLLMGQGLHHLSEHNCDAAIRAFNQLPAPQYNTGWVLCQVGQAYFERVDHAQAKRAFEWAHTADPHRLQHLELYSTVLWHMKEEVQLSHLAQEAIALDRLSPQAWCVMGNCFSLQKEHDTALRYFQRALQLDPAFTYAYTLCGHEYFANEDFEKAQQFYRNAITKNPRHYNAWYGLGQIYYRQEKYDNAASNFQHALAINPYSSVLRCYTGMACQKQGNSQQALVWLDRAIEADARNPLARFEKANVLLTLGQEEEALTELQALKGIAPREASVCFLMGKIYKRLDQPDKAMSHFCQALDLKPSSADANLIKSAIEKIHVPDDQEDEEV